MNNSYKPLTRSTAHRMIAGLCAGIGESANIDPTVIRLIAVLLLFLTGPGVVIAYFILVLIIPEAPVRQLS